jgi:hypothetical protein
MAEKTAYSRIINKHDTEANWLKAASFIPKKGEIIVYDADSNYSYERAKIGDGVTVVSNLPFVDDAKGNHVVTATSTDGITYTATVPGVKKLTTGTSFIIVPNKASTSTQPTLNINGLGSKYIRRRLSSLATSAQVGYTAAWLAVNMPFRVMYDGTQWIVEGHEKPTSADLYGNVPINKGGTGADNAIDALANLGIYIGPTEPTDSNIRIWINTSEEGTGIIPVLPRIATITLTKNGWAGSNPYSQTVSVATLTATDRVELCPTAEQILALQNDDASLLASNDGGVLTLHAIGGKPSADMTMQILLTAVSYV